MASITIQQDPRERIIRSLTRQIAELDLRNHNLHHEVAHTRASLEIARAEIANLRQQVAVLRETEAERALHGGTAWNDEAIESDKGGVETHYAIKELTHLLKEKE